MFQGSLSLGVGNHISHLQAGVQQNGEGQRCSRESDMQLFTCSGHGGVMSTELLNCGVVEQCLLTKHTQFAGVTLATSEPSIQRPSIDAPSADSLAC